MTMERMLNQIPKRLKAKLDAAGIPYHLEADTSIYFMGPDGERLELISDPLGEMYGMTIG